MSQDTFSLFLQDANKQSVPQILLFVFARFELDSDATVEQQLAFAKQEGGKLRPVFSVKKLSTELSDFSTLKINSELNGQPWDVVFMAQITGAKGQQPVPGKIGKGLKMMVDSVVAGNVGQFLALNQKGERLSFD